LVSPKRILWVNVSKGGWVSFTNPTPLFPIVRAIRRGRRYYLPMPFSCTIALLFALLERGVIKRVRFTLEAHVVGFYAIQRGRLIEGDRRLLTNLLALRRIDGRKGVRVVETLPFKIAFDRR